MEARFGFPRRWIMLSLPFLSGFPRHLLLFARTPRVSPVVGEMNRFYAQFGLVYSASTASLILFCIPRKIPIQYW
jgi:hypothetical protein